MYQGEYNGSKKHEADLSQVLDRAWKAGLESMIITGGSLSDASEAIELSKQDGKTAIGIDRGPGKSHVLFPIFYY